MASDLGLHCLPKSNKDLWALVCDVSCDLVTLNFPFCMLGQVWYLIVSIPDPCCLTVLVFVFVLLCITLCPL